MNTPVWRFAEDISAQPMSPLQIMEETAAQLWHDTGELVLGRVIETVSTPANAVTSSILYALYLIVPKLKNYSYRLLEVIPQGNLLNPYPATIRLFGQQSGQVDEVSAGDETEFRTMFLYAVQHPITAQLLSAIKQQVDIIEHYRNDTLTG